MNDIHHLLTRSHFPIFRAHFLTARTRKGKKIRQLSIQDNTNRLTLLTVYVSVCLGHSSS